MLGDIEKKLGLPRLSEVSDLLTEDRMTRMNTLLARLERLSKNPEAIKQAMSLLRLIKELDDNGTLTRVNLLLEELGPITRGKALNRLLDKVDKLVKVVEVLMK